MHFVDTHVHLESGKINAHLPAVLDRARRQGLKLMVTVGTSVATSRAAVDLARSHPDLRAAVGVHPHDAVETASGDLDAIEALARMPEVVAVGETGLDFFRMLSPRDHQVQLFQWHADLALRLRKPLIVHNRQADRDCRSLLDSMDPAPRIILHCFSSDLDMVRWACQRDAFISVAGQVTYPKANSLRNAVARIPDDRLLIETDCPYLTPQPRRSRAPFNEPAFLVYTAQCLAELKNMPLAELARLTTRNAERAFGLEAGPAVPAGDGSP